MALKSMKIAAIFGFFSSFVLVFTGDTSARTIARVQPAKFAAMEALYEGERDAPLTVFGILGDRKDEGDYTSRQIKLKIGIPGLLSVMTHGDRDAHVAGVDDIIYGNDELGLLSVGEKIRRGRIARDLLFEYKEAKEAGDEERTASVNERFSSRDFQDKYFRYFGYAYIDKPGDILPNIPVIFYSFHLMVALGFLFMVVQLMTWIFIRNKTLEKNKFFLWILLLTIPLPYLASELGWIVTEMGRQPWIIQDLMPVGIAVSSLSTSAVQTTFILFAVLFTVLLIAEVSIMRRQIKNGPKIEEE